MKHVNFKLDPLLIDKIEEWMKKQDDPELTMSAALRILLHSALVDNADEMKRAIKEVSIQEGIYKGMRIVKLTMNKLLHEALGDQLDG